MIRFDGMSPEVMEAMCTPMHQILPMLAQPRSQSSAAVPTIASHLPTRSSTASPAPGSLYLGSISATLDRDLLRAHHITHLVQVLDVPWLPVSEKDGFRCLRIDILDIPTADLRPHLEGACEYISNALQLGGNVLVHCQQGVSRSPAIVIAYLIHNLGMSYDQAFAAVKRCRPCINPNVGFVDALRAWETRWRPAAPKRLTTYTGSAHSPAANGVTVPPFARSVSYAGPTSSTASNVPNSSKLRLPS